MTHIDVFADVVCPFTHVGLHGLVRARTSAGATAPVRVHAWPLEWINGEPLTATHAAREVAALRAQVAPDLFVAFDPATFPHTSIPAFGLAATAYAVNDTLGETVSLALRDALFEHGLDIADDRVLGGIAEEFGLSLDRGSAEAAVRADWELGQARGVRGSPHFFAAAHDWFCPTLDINTVDDEFKVRISQGLRDFYSAALG